MLDEGRRLDVLAALGIDVYRLRAPDAQQRAAPPDGVAAHSAPPPAPRLVVACDAAARRDARTARQLNHVVRALGVAGDEVAWIGSAPDGSFVALPAVDAYLLIGAAQRCAAALPIERQNAAAIALTPEPPDMMRDGATRRALWQALKPLARRLHDGGGAGP
jgi:DNA polymerase III psi subunit